MHHHGGVRGRRGLDAVGADRAADVDRRGRARRREGIEPVAKPRQSPAIAAKDTAKRNQVAGDPLQLADSDIVFGNGVQANEASRFKFTAGGKKPNAVQVTGKRTKGSLTGPVDLLFAGVLGVKQFQPAETATSTQLDRDICLVVDRSGSMMWTLTRLEACRQARPIAVRPIRRGAAGVRSTSRSRRSCRNSTRPARTSTSASCSYSSNTTECGNTYNISDINSDLGRATTRRFATRWPT